MRWLLTAVLVVVTLGCHTPPVNPPVNPTPDADASVVPTPPSPPVPVNCGTACAHAGVRCPQSGGADPNLGDCFDSCTRSHDMVYTQCIAGIDNCDDLKRCDSKLSQALKHKKPVVNGK
jgi:hypothetical protein